MGERDLLNHAKLETKFYGVPDMNMIGASGASAGGAAGAPVVAVQGGAGHLAVVQMGADGDEVHIFKPIPYDLDRGQKVIGRIWFFHSATDTDDPVWKVKTKFHEKLVTVVDLDTGDDEEVTFDEHICSSTAESLEITDWYDLQWDDSITEDDVAVGIIVECDDLGDDSAASAGEIELYGLEIAYVPDAHLLDGVPDVDAALASNALPTN